MYEKEGTIFLKPHPRDLLDYQKLFAEYPQFDASMPMEMLNFFPNLRFKGGNHIYGGKGTSFCG